MGITRRKFNRLLYFTMFSLASGGCTLWEEEESPSQCITPFTEDQKILFRFCEAVVPGKSEDPEDSPGAPEVCAMNYMYDDSLLFRKIAPTVSFLLEQKSRKLFKKSFINLGLDERIEVILAVKEEFPQIILLIRFVKSAFYGGGYSDVGWRYMGYNGPNLGYFNDPQFSFRRPVGRELTQDGNMP